MNKENYSILIPTTINPKPNKTEIEIAYILSQHFCANVKFVPRSNLKTPDYLIKGVTWELKSPTGTGKHNIQHCIQDAAEQSPNIIIDGRKSKINPNKLYHEIKYQFNLVKKAKRLLYINKSGKVIEISKK